jgi:hypothetical protein
LSASEGINFILDVTARIWALTVHTTYVAYRTYRCVFLWYALATWLPE